jgi:DNA invertase Pin-like site-specific DNA recombinase
VCIAPYHLRWGTHEENMLEKAQRLRCVGNANTKAKLDPEKVRQIRLRHEHGESRAALAAAYGVSKTTLWSVLHGRTWRHVEAEPA